MPFLVQGIPVEANVTLPTNTERILGSVADFTEKTTTSIPTFSNAGIALFATQTAGVSIIGYLGTTNKAAKIFYALSVISSSISATSASASTLAKSSDFDILALLAQANGYAFYTVAQKSHLAALANDGKLNQYRARGFGRNSSDIGFIIPNVNGKYKIIIDGVVCILTLYGYSKLLIFVYRKTKNFMLKKSNAQNSRLIVSKRLKSNSRYGVQMISRIKSRIKKIQIFRTTPKVQFIRLD